MKYHYALNHFYWLNLRGLALYLDAMAQKGWSLVYWGPVLLIFAPAPPEKWTHYIIMADNNDTVLRWQEAGWQMLAQYEQRFWRRLMVMTAKEAQSAPEDWQDIARNLSASEAFATQKRRCWQIVLVAAALWVFFMAMSPLPMAVQRERLVAGFYIGLALVGVIGLYGAIEWYCCYQVQQIGQGRKAFSTHLGRGLLLVQAVLITAGLGIIIYMWLEQLFVRQQIINFPTMWLPTMTIMLLVRSVHQYRNKQSYLWVVVLFWSVVLAVIVLILLTAVLSVGRP